MRKWDCFAGFASSYSNSALFKACAVAVGAGLPAKHVARCLAPALLVFAGKPAPTCTARQLYERPGKAAHTVRQLLPQRPAKRLCRPMESGRPACNQ
ncbi:hypothetical protein EI693_06085 [Pseudomonas oryziphila]|uniref:Uncharacterized protein n=1 Tax=Pseudomonas oryziphila TaxID=2894079 RepID=A0ABN5TCQ4_9PSED|nr:hypothetical protein EI693_06085 [Pseudomonas oryziphila]